MQKIAFYLTIILSFPLLLAGENSYEKSKEEAEYYRKLNLARAYERGTVLKKDEKKAFFYYYRAATNWNYTEPEALEYLEKKAKEGNPYAQWGYGRYYDYDELRSYDPEKAFYWYSKAAEKNIPVALNNLALMYIFGRGVKKDVKKIKELMLKAAELGIESAQECLVRLYSGYYDVTESNYKEAFKWIEILVKKGSLSAKYNMGVCYFYGRGVPEDKSKAVEIWKSILEEVVEERNYIRNKVCRTLYECYNKGSGVEKDEEKSKVVLLFMTGDPLRSRKKLEKALEKYGTIIQFTFQNPFY